MKKVEYKGRNPRRIMFTKEEYAAFKTYFDKGPVGLPSAEDSARRAFGVIGHYITDEELGHLTTAEIHSKDVGEGRREWDGICKKIKERLGLNL